MKRRRLRNNIWSKRNEMNMSVLLNGENPDPAKLQALQKEINGLEESRWLKNVWNTGWKPAKCRTR